MEARFNGFGCDEIFMLVDGVDESSLVNVVLILGILEEILEGDMVAK